VFSLNELSLASEVFVVETTFREVNFPVWGNHLVAGLGSLTCTSVHFLGTFPVLVGVYKFIVWRDSRSVVKAFADLARFE